MLNRLMVSHYNHVEFVEEFTHVGTARTCII